MKILHKYVLKEHVGPLVFALATLTSLLLLNYIAKQFGNLVGKGLPWTVFVEFFLLSIPFTVALTFPMAVLVATLYAFGRLAAENEITALKASGVSMVSIMAPVLWAAVGVTLFMLAFNDQLLPRTNHRLAVLQSDIVQTKPAFALREQVINEVQAGRLYLRTSRIDQASNRMRQVFIYDLSTITRRRTIYADSGDLHMAANQRDLLFTLYDGYMLEVPSTQLGQLQRIYFAKDNIVVRDVGSEFVESKGEQTKFEREMSVCEMNDVVNREWTRYDVVRSQFLTNRAEAIARDMNVSPGARALDPASAPRTTLGNLYCGLLHMLHVPELQAQTPSETSSAPDQQPIPPPSNSDDTTSSDTSLSVVAETSAGTPAGEAQLEVQPGEMVDLSEYTIEAQRSTMEESLSRIARYDIEIHKKFALSVACFVFVLLGAPIALRFPRGGIGMTIGVSLLVFGLYYVGLIGGSALAERRIIPAWIAMWIANVVFTGIALVLLRNMGREGSTARGGDLSEVWEVISEKIPFLRKRSKTPAGEST